MTSARRGANVELVSARRGETRDRTPTSSLLAFLRSMHGPFKGLGLPCPGHGKVSPDAELGEPSLEETADSEVTRETVRREAEMLAEYLEFAQQATEQAEAVNQKHLVVLEKAYLRAQEQLDQMLALQSSHLDVAKREERVRSREAFIQDAVGRVQAQLDKCVGLLAQGQEVLREARTVQSDAQGLQQQIRTGQDSSRRVSQNSRGAVSDSNDSRVS